MGITNFPNGISSFGSVVHGGNSPTLGREFHVRKTADAGYARWKDQMEHTVRGGGNSVHTTIESAVAAADDFDTIWVYPGVWAPVGTLTIDQKHLKLLAADMGPNCGLSGTEIWQLGTNTHSSLTGTNVPIFTLNGANNVEIAGLRLVPYDDPTSIGISVGETTECKGTWIHDNILYNLESTQGSLIRLGASGVEAQYSLIENNYIYCGGCPSTGTGQIDWVHATRSMIRNNNFMINQNSANLGCITMQHTAYMRGHILDNTFWGMAEATAGMVCNAVHVDAQTVPGDLYVDGNHTVNLTTPFAAILIETSSFGLNYKNEGAISSA